MTRTTKDKTLSLLLLRSLLSRVVDSRAAGLYLLLFAIAIGTATFIENDFGTSAAQKLVYRSSWFTALLALFSASILYNIYKFNMIKKKKWALLSFHLAIIIILIGAGITRYFSYEGVMHIRENSSSDTFLSSETFLQFYVSSDQKQYVFDAPVLFASLGNNRWHQSYQIDNNIIDIKVKEFIPNPIQTITKTPSGIPTLKVVISGANGREEYFISQGEHKYINQLLFNFTTTPLPQAVNINLVNDKLTIQADREMAVMIMATQQRNSIPSSSTSTPLLLKSLYTLGNHNFVFSEFESSGKVTITSEDQKVKNDSQVAIKLNVSVNEQMQETVLFGKKGLLGQYKTLNFEGLQLSASYGAKPIQLPFDITLRQFIMERYPGTDQAASYASEVTLIDQRTNLNMDYRIFMNNILNYDGYRFFQSSFDPDEKGTYLSVNHDHWGTLVSYFGYFMLTLGMVLTLFHKESRFAQIRKQLKQMRTTVILIGLLASSSTTYSQKATPTAKDNIQISTDHAETFSELVVQDYRGRMKPMHTLTREILRKVSRKESINGLNADQVVLSMFANNDLWSNIPMIKIGNHPEIIEIINPNQKLATYRDCFDDNSQYKLTNLVRKAYNTPPADKGTLEKELIKLDERINIMNMVFSGDIFRVIPLANDANNTWIAHSTQTTGQNAQSWQTAIAASFFPAYRSALLKGIQTNDYQTANHLITELKSFQADFGHVVIPSANQLKMEIVLNNLKVFNRLAVIYAFLGVVFLFCLFLQVFKPSLNLKIPFKILLSLLALSFAFHTIGLGLRWYVSERAPWSNGYESMIYIAWTTTLAGLIFTRKSFGGLAATTIVSATILLVALLSYLDPEITPLVPVLKSYWLTIHVSLEAGSYGFLMLGGIIGIINLILLSLINQKNEAQIIRIIKEMTLLSESTLIGGLIMISTGTYLGGIWANESWGRYWGWDAKETWALVTILIYAFILHMRIIPKLYNLYSYNLATIFGLASVIMTYYGVNYYLSGLHSYAAGDPVPIPTWVPMLTACIILISITAYSKKRKFKV